MEQNGQSIESEYVRKWSAALKTESRQVVTKAHKKQQATEGFNASSMNPT
jgi:hypothetical protein